MIIDNHDADYLMLCGLCRYIPVTLSNRYDAPSLQKRRIQDLLQCNAVKYAPKKDSIKLTYVGRDLLCRMGFRFPEDARPYKDGNKYKRRLAFAESIALIHFAGINVFADKIEDLNKSSNIYLPSPTVRTQDTGKVLAGTKFLGVLKLNEIVYVPYYVTVKDEWLYPKYEDNTFTGIVKNIKDIKSTKLIFAGKTLQELWRYLFQEKDLIRKDNGSISYSKAFEEFKNNICLVSCDNIGALPLKIMAAKDYRRRLVDNFCIAKKLPHELSYCDGIYINQNNEQPFIIAIDLDLKRLYRAIEQTKRISKTPIVLCLNSQEEILDKMFEASGAESIVFIKLDKKTVYEILDLKDHIEVLRAFNTKDGSCVLKP